LFAQTNQEEDSLPIPSDHHYLLDYADEQLVEIAFQERNGYALAILQERQCQDAGLAEPELRCRHQARKPILRRIHNYFLWTGKRKSKRGGNQQQW
jgi:hypothetical protein